MPKPDHSKTTVYATPDGKPFMVVKTDVTRRNGLEHIKTKSTSVRIEKETR